MFGGFLAIALQSATATGMLAAGFAAKGALSVVLDSRLKPAS